MTPRTARDLLITALAGALLLAWDFSGLDLPTVRLFGNAQGFAWRDAWLTKTALHEGGRIGSWVLLAGLALGVLRAGLQARRHGPTLNLRGPAPFGHRLRWFAVTLLCLVAVPTLKRYSTTSCPWDLAEFGGVAPYVRHWAFGVSDGGPGHCFPSGHAVAAFAFFSLYFQLRDERPVAARWALGAVLLVGCAFGWAQLVRGAHFPSHTLWSAWICWAVCVAAAALFKTAPGAARGTFRPI